MKETAEYLNDSAVLFASEGSHKEAIACLRKGLLLEPGNGILWFNLALSYRAIGNRKEARTALMNAVQANPADPDIIDTLAVVLHELGEDSSAGEAYRQALELAPGNGRIWNNFGVLQFSQARYADAASSFEKLWPLFPILKMLCIISGIPMMSLEKPNSGICVPGFSEINSGKTESNTWEFGSCT